MKKKIDATKKTAIGVGIAGAIAALMFFLFRKKTEPPVVHTCPYCGAVFSTYEAMLEHIQTEHSDEPLPGEECSVDSDCPEDFVCVGGVCIPRQV